LYPKTMLINQFAPQRNAQISGPDELSVLLKRDVYARETHQNRNGYRILFSAEGAREPGH